MTDQQIAETVTLGMTDIRVSPLGIGTWQWGDRFVWGYGGSYTDADLQEVFRTSLALGINFFDTAEMYGFPTHRSEKLLGQFMQGTNQRVVVATKFFPLPWRFRKGQLLTALRGSLKRLRMARVDLYQIHWPSPPASVETWADALADAVDAGLARAVGVSNYNVDQMRRTHAVLAKRGIQLASNQVDYSLFKRGPERSGLAAACHELGVSIIAYSPLAMGLATGKYTPENPPKGFRGKKYDAAFLAAIQPVIAQLRELGAAHGGKTPAQVALNWLMCKGAIPIPGAKNVKQLQDNVGALGWRLTNDEVAALDAAEDAIHRR